MASEKLIEREGRNLEIAPSCVVIMCMNAKRSVHADMELGTHFTLEILTFRKYLAYSASGSTYEGVFEEWYFSYTRSLQTWLYRLFN